MRIVAQRTFLILTVLGTIVVGIAVRLAVVAPIDSDVQPKSVAADSQPDSEPSLTDQSNSDATRRVPFDSPFRNITSHVQYVGDTQCAKCHSAICDTYHAHPMGRSASYTKETSNVEQDSEEPIQPSKGGPFTLSVLKNTEGTVHRVATTAAVSAHADLHSYDVQATIAIGSGAHGRSYLASSNGQLWQSPISWYSSAARWDVSPGFDLSIGRQRTISANCLYCHVHNFEQIPSTINTYREPLFPIQASIGCERCHGPGALHVEERTKDERTTLNEVSTIDTSIVNPKHLSHSLQMSICEQCHLQGQERVARFGRNEQEYRPGLHFDDFVSVFVQHPDLPSSNKQVSQFEQLDQAKCKSPSGERLLCTSCHNPHESPSTEARDQYYRKQCLACHKSNIARACSTAEADRAAVQDRCMDCHMPKAQSANIAHSSITDHRILKSRPKPNNQLELPQSMTPLVYFHREPRIAKSELERDLGIALSRFAGKQPPAAETLKIIGRQSRGRLMTALKSNPNDIDALVALSQARGALGESAERFISAEHAYQLAPQSEAVMAEYMQAAEQLGKLPLAVEIATKLIARSNQSIDYRLARMASFVAMSDWASAEMDAESILSFNPLHPMAMLVTAASLHRRGENADGSKRANVAFELTTNPVQRASLKDWFLHATKPPVE